MNIILLSAKEADDGFLPSEDPRAKHLVTVLGVKIGDAFYIGVVGEKRGLATVTAVDDRGISWTAKWEKEAQVALPLTLLVGLPRPQTARKILHDAASLGARCIHFFITEKGDPAYAQSSLWRDGEAEELLRKGTAQAFSTLVPSLAIHHSLADALVMVGQKSTRIFLDVYEVTAPLGDAVHGAREVTLAVGSERGWSDGERDLLRRHGFTGAHMGDRVLRVETACVAACAVTLAATGAWKKHSALQF